MASSHHFADSRQVSARVAPPLRCCAVPLLLPVRAHPYGRPCTTPSISLVVNIMYIQTFCEHLTVLHIFDETDLYRFEVRPEIYAANARLIVSPPSLSPSHPPTPPLSRLPALTTLPSLVKFQLVWRPLCEALLAFSSFPCQKHPSLLSRLV